MNKITDELKQALFDAQVHKALGGDTVMLIWLGKQLLNQRDTYAENRQTKEESNT